MSEIVLLTAMGREMEQPGVPAEVAKAIVDMAAGTVVKTVRGVRP